MGDPDPKVDVFFRKAVRWHDEFALLRAILLDSPLRERLKWRQPVYELDGSNVAMIAGFKDNCGVSFFKGALLDDPAGILVKPGDNTQGARIARFTEASQIARCDGALRALVGKAIEVQRAGLTVDYSDRSTLSLAVELQDRLDADPALKSAFAALTPGRQRSHNLYVGGAKQAGTRETRAGRCIPDILAGKGFNEYGS